MTAPAASDLYSEAIQEARFRGYRLGRAALEALRLAFEDAARRVEFDLRASDVPLTQQRAEALRRELDVILRELERTTGQTTNSAVRLTVQDVVRIHERAVVQLFEQYVGRMNAQITQELSRVNARAVAVLAARNEISGGSAGFQTLMRLHMGEAGPDLDRLISSAIARGVSVRNLTRDIADFLVNGVANLTPYGLMPTDMAGLATIRSDAERIAITETLSALRESSAQAADASQIVEAHHWQLSGNHPVMDECDILAETDFYGIGPGWYPADRLPIGPHPRCACTHGAVRLRDPSTWNTPRPAGAALAIDWGTFDPASYVQVEWSDLRTARAITALRRAVMDPIGRRARRAA